MTQNAKKWVRNSAPTGFLLDSDVVILEDCINN